MKILENIPYSGTAGDRGVGDLFLPENLSPQTPLALSIHGGGWVALDKSRMAGIAEFLCTELGFAVFSINYRLAGDTPWHYLCHRHPHFQLHGGDVHHAEVSAVQHTERE